MTVHISNHPLVKHKVSLLREHNISVKSFRELTNEVSALLMTEATCSMAITNKPIKCWSGDILAPLLDEKSPTLVPIIRAGMGMLDGALSLLPTAKISMIGLKRDEESATTSPDGSVSIGIETYYENIVNDIDQRRAFVLDPMLATGGSAIAAISMLKASGCKNISALFLVAAPEGVDALTKAHPDITVYIAALDEKLNEQGYILPGLGDAGDKIFGTLA